MRDFREPKPETSSHSAPPTSPGERTAERQYKFADEDVPPRAPRDASDGRYDLSWDGVSGGCGTDEGY